MLDLAQLTVDQHMPATVKGSLRSRRLGALPRADQTTTRGSAK
jgi:hypothetical protein